jgi:hypothetical protein
MSYEYKKLFDRILKQENRINYRPLYLTLDEKYKVYANELLDNTKFTILFEDLKNKERVYLT